jgi:hypothetical protein
MKPSNDREAIGLILNGLQDQGFTDFQVVQDAWCPDEITDAKDADDATRLVCEVDEAPVYCKFPDGATGWLFFVLGNDPEEVLNDHTVNLSEFVDPIIDPWWV